MPPAGSGSASRCPICRRWRRPSGRAGGCDISYDRGDEAGRAPPGAARAGPEGRDLVPRGAPGRRGAHLPGVAGHRGGAPGRALRAADGFDLPSFWAESSAAYEREVPRLEVVVRVDPRTWASCPTTSGTPAWRPPNGWTRRIRTAGLASGCGSTIPATRPAGCWAWAPTSRSSPRRTCASGWFSGTWRSRAPRPFLKVSAVR